MRIKLLLKWNIREGKELEYNDFVVNDFIPRVKRLGMRDIHFWYTTFGDCEQIQASGVTPTREQMDNILESEGWKELLVQLDDYVQDLSTKIVRAGSEFQL